METSTIAIIVLAFIVTVIISVAIRHFRAKKTEDTDPFHYDLKELLTFPSNPIKEFEPIKSHVSELKKAERCRDALHSAILKNLRDNGYVPRCTDPWRQAYGYLELPDLIELQNIISLKPIIEVIEDQYKRFEEAESKAYKEHEFTANLILKVMEKLNMDQEMQKLVSASVIDEEHRNGELYKVLWSPEAKGIIERCIAEVLKGER